MANNRHLSRIAVVQTIFAWEFRGGEPDLILEYVLEEFYPKLTSIAFGHETLKGVLDNRDRMKEVITQTAPEWEFEKIAAVDRAILEVGVYEILYSKDVPPVVAINEAIEIAKQFGTSNSSKFINGVLSTVMKQYKPNKNDSK